MEPKLLPQLAKAGYGISRLGFISSSFLILLFSHSVVSSSVTPWTTVPRASLSLAVSQSLLKLMSLTQWCHPTTSSSVAPFSFCRQSFPASGSFPTSWLFASGGLSIKASASASVLPMNIQGGFPLRSTGLIFFLTKGLSRVFSSTTVGKRQFFSVQPFLWSNSYICIWLLEKP